MHQADENSGLLEEEEKAWGVRVKMHTHIHTDWWGCCAIKKSKTNSTLCASASINVFICMSRKLLSSAMNSCSNYWFCCLFLALDFFLYFAILVCSLIFNETFYFFLFLSVPLYTSQSLWQTLQPPSAEAALIMII